ncbi:MAG: NB-ARC domain-containing protein [Nostoc sp. DedQUE08]|uniref:NB-ARC domain-containing protein n=1 Tax=Nostoc sp. DedQUE08 TaxID=3075393 RepID=UPI002AD487F5|nr:NB-ARC domain-containing protein [Nostoc sp. DedQUE08]MDZ8064751.1 NB-ARC domain-containing protein [Nostoc sp. DedQUE08]
MQKRSLRRLWKQIILFLSNLAGFLRGNRRRLKRRRHPLRDEVAQTHLDRQIPSQAEKPILGNVENNETSVTSLNPDIKSQFKQTISGNKNVGQNVEGDNNIIVGQVEGSLTINYHRPTDRPFQAPSLPAHFVDRPQVTVEIKARLLANTSNAGALLISAIHGLGGIGKTTLVTALAHDEDIQKRFSGGVLWATLGQEPDILSELSKWVQALEGDYKISATNIETAKAHLRSLLHDKAVLLIVDDAWEPDKVKPFLVASSQSQLLITSRRADVADAVSAYLQQLNLMTPEESLELISKSLEREIEEVEKQEALRVAKAVGYLPIALNLVAARVKRGVAWVKLETALKQEVANLKILYGPRQENFLEATFNLSLKALRDFNEQAWENFIWLGILPEDVTIAVPMAVTLWDIESQDEANECLELLWNDALLQSDSPVFVGGVEWKGYKIHDLLHDVARSRLIKSPPTGMGFNLLNAHSQLLERYRLKTEKNLWHILPNDGYIHQNLVWHLEKAERVEEIHSLLREESQTSSNGWFEAREKLGQAEDYITDFFRAWELAEANWTESTLPQVVGLQCRYALITASLNSLAGNLPVKLLVALIKNNFWTPEQGLAYALQNPNPQQKVNSLKELVNYLPSNLKELALQKALAAAREIQDESDRANALSVLAEKLPELLPEALAAARSIQSEYSRANALSVLAEKLTPELFPEALTAARSIQYEEHRVNALSALAKKLPELLPEALAVARSMPNGEYRANALNALAEKLPELLPEALAAARLIQHEYSRAMLLSALAEKLPELLPEALAAARSIKYGEYGDKDYSANAWSALAEKLPPELFPEALAAARSIQDESNRANALSALAEKMPELLPEALAAARSIQFKSDRANALSALAEKLPELLPEALAATRSIQDKRYRAPALSALAEKLPPELLPEALAAARSIQDESNRANTLSALAEKLPELLPEALAAARAIQDERYRAPALSALAEKLPPELLPEALAATRSIQDKEYRANALSALAEKLPELLPEALAAARSIQFESNRANALSALAEKLPELLPEALAATRSIQFYEDTCANAWSALAEKLTPELFPEALAAVRSIEDEEYCANALSALAKKLPPELLPEALAVARSIEDEEYRANALSALAEKLPELLPEALATARSIQFESNRANALSALVEKLPPELLSEALAAVREIKDERYRANALSALAKKLLGLLPEALAVARSIQHESERAYALNALAEELPELLPEALAAARSIQDDSDRANALSALADKLPLELLQEALVVARSIQHDSDRANALSALAFGLSQMPSAKLFPLWQDTLHQLSLRARPDLLQDIPLLSLSDISK